MDGHSISPDFSSRYLPATRRKRLLRHSCGCFDDERLLERCRAGRRPRSARVAGSHGSNWRTGPSRATRTSRSDRRYGTARADWSARATRCISGQLVKCKQLQPRRRCVLQRLKLHLSRWQQHRQRTGYEPDSMGIADTARRDGITRAAGLHWSNGSARTPRTARSDRLTGTIWPNRATRPAGTARPGRDASGTCSAPAMVEQPNLLCWERSLRCGLRRSQHLGGELWQRQRHQAAGQHRRGGRHLHYGGRRSRGRGL